MTRNPYAADDFLSEVREQHAKASAEPVGDPDGLGVYRTFKFDKTSSKTLLKVLPEISDERIESFEEKTGHALITFTSHTVADRRGRFALAEARTVVDAN